MSAKTYSNKDPKPSRGWFTWISLGLVAALAAASVMASMVLRDHAHSRLRTMDELGQMEIQATAQSSIVWRALTLTLAEERMAFIRMRGVEQQGRNAIYERLDALRELESEGARLNALLGFELDEELLDELDAVGSSFLGGVQGALGQMSLSSDQIRRRLNYWDMNFGAFHDTIAKVKERDLNIAEASSRIANIVTAIAALVTLVAAGLFVLRLSQVLARREFDLQEERMSAVTASESRFRELVQNASDLILVLEPTGEIRYATPSARVLASSVEGRAGEGSLTEQQSASAEALSAAQAIEQAVTSGALHDAGVALQNAQCAIVDVMGLTPEEFLANGHSEVAITDSEGSLHIFDVHATDLSDHSEIGGIVLNAREITDRKMLEERLRYQAHHDPLTDLPNRREFKLRFDSLSTEQRVNAAVLFIDLDGFKLVNDSYGHNVGDGLLVSTACRIGSCLTDADMLARQGGDEFLVLVEGDALAIAERIKKILEPPFLLEGTEVFVTASIGVVADVSELDSEGAAQRADIAMYVAKQAGKAQAVAFTEEMLVGAPERLQLEADFRRALERDEFTVYYQPKVGLKSGVTESLEALVRWEHPTRGMVGPDTFIPFAEETGLVSELGRKVLRQACMDAVRWQDRGIVVAVNLSPVQFRNPNLLQEVRDAIKDSGLDPHLLELEITESAVLGDVEKTVEMLDELKKLGIKLAIDDFGTGYSNLSHLKHFNVDVLKIDQAFVRGGNPGVTENLCDAAIVEAVIGMARAFGLDVVAEGVESEAQAAQLHALGADLGQGYYFSRPVSSDAIDGLLVEEDERIASGKTIGEAKSSGAEA